MTRDDLEKLEIKLDELVVTKRGQGDYNTDAPTLRFLLEAVRSLVQHIRHTEAPKKK